MNGSSAARIASSSSATCSGSSTCLPSNERVVPSRSAITVARRSNSVVAVDGLELAHLFEVAVEDRPAAVDETSPPAAGDVFGVQAGRQPVDEIRAHLAVVGNRAPELDVGLALLERGAERIAHVGTFTPTVT